MTSIHKTEICSPSTPTTSINTSNHKNSLKGTKLARRARSFKDDLFERISQMRTPTNSMGRSHSPHSPRSKHMKSHLEDMKPPQSLDYHVRQIKNALKHFKDVISKNKLEVLPGNGTVVLELIANMYTALQTYTLNEQSSVLISATTQVYLSLGKLIKLCDEILLCEDEKNCPSLNNQNVTEVVDLVENAVQNLASLASEKLKEKETGTNFSSSIYTSPNTLHRPTTDVAGQRTSLPDIPLTPKERNMLEKTTSNPIRSSHSTESILRDSSPPPKPPLPNRANNPPPLPPKKRSQIKPINVTNESDCNIDNSFLTCGLDRLSLRSRSPDENSSLLSASAGSLDSAFNHSKEEEELKALALDTSFEDRLLEDDVEQMFAQSFASMQSIRASMQSVSTKRSSEHSMQSHKSSIASSTELSSIQRAERNSSDIDNDQNLSINQYKSLSYITNESYKNSDYTVSTIDNSTKLYNEKSEKFIETTPKLEKLNNYENTISFKKIITNDKNNLNNPDLYNHIPPALPIKTRAKNINREKHLSQYDNVEETDFVPNILPKEDILEFRNLSPIHLQSKHQSLIDPRQFRTLGDNDRPPPLPVKKKHIIAYMEICSASARTSGDHLRHSVHTYNVTHSSDQFTSSQRNITHSQTMSLSPFKKDENIQLSPLSLSSDEKPPALPPKKQNKTPNKNPTIITTPPPSPKIGIQNYDDNKIKLGGISKQVLEMATVTEESNDLPEGERIDNSSLQLLNEEYEGMEVVLRKNSRNSQEKSPTASIKIDNIPNLLEEIDISTYLIFKKDGEDGPDVKGGYIDALIVHASRVQKNNENAFSEAFITTFRTFILPLDLCEKLIHRYTLFCCQVSDQKQKAAKETFSLLVRVVNDLTASDLNIDLMSLLAEVVYQLVCSGQLSMAKLLRNKIVEKVIAYKDQKYLTSHYGEQQRNIVTNLPSLLELKSIEIAEQMTLLDAELFQKIEIPEVLLFAKEQCEERSPNLNKFTEHFNKMSYWARSQILKQEDAKDRERHVIKFIKIMKHLRKMNNYNSYLALLSALDSAPIRRLEWHKTITEGLKEYCALIDSSSSFRVYRQALAETSPPCIPYIGLVLQDLTFVHVGNPDFLKDCIINFSKRWQQHNIIVNMKRFKKCTYPFKKNDKIIKFFENFENFFGEEQMWQISENIKPRGKRIVQN